MPQVILFNFQRGMKALLERDWERNRVPKKVQGLFPRFNLDDAKALKVPKWAAGFLSDGDQAWTVCYILSFAQCGSLLFTLSANFIVAFDEIVNWRAAI